MYFYNLGKVAFAFIFCMLAFAFLDLPWVSWAFGDYSVKVIASLILLVPYRVFIKTFVPIHKQV